MHAILGHCPYCGVQFIGTIDVNHLTQYVFHGTIRDGTVYATSGIDRDVVTLIPELIAAAHKNDKTVA